MLGPGMWLQRDEPVTSESLRMDMGWIQAGRRAVTADAQQAELVPRVGFEPTRPS